MRIVLQRVSRAEVRIRPEGRTDASRTAGRIANGYVVLVGIAPTDTMTEARWMAEKITSLRLFPDGHGRMNKDIREQGGSLLVVSQFTLYGDTRKGRRPSFVGAAPPEMANQLYERFIAMLREMQHTVQTGEFGALMDVELVNDGPVTIWLERDATVPITSPGPAA